MALTRWMFGFHRRLVFFFDHGTPLVDAVVAELRARGAEVGTGVFGGMLAATFLAIFFVPLLFVLIRSLSRRLKKETPPAQDAPDNPEKERDYQHA